jgi:cyanophycinase
MSKRSKGTLVIIGGAERKDDERTVLKVVADRIRANQRLLIVTAASYEPDGTAKDYMRIFKELGVSEMDVADVRTREDAERQDLVEKCERANAIFFTGGDQLRITSQMGDSPMYRCMQQRYEDGAMIIGTSAGAAAMPFTMIVGGPSDESNRVSALSMAPGLGLLDYVVIDSHFAQRGRMGRLIGAVMQNPRNLGLGIDEATAIVVEKGERFDVVGPGAIYVVDGSQISYSSLSEERAEGIVTVHDVRLHVLGEGDCYDLTTRRPIVVEPQPETQPGKRPDKQPEKAHAADDEA